MEEYLVCEWSLSYGIYLGKARRFTADEKKKYADWFKEYGFAGIKGTDDIKLEYLGIDELEATIPSLDKPDGAFSGCSNKVYIINQDQWDRLVALDSRKKAEEQERKRLDDIKECQEIIENCKRQGKLYTKEEAAGLRDNYNDLYNEGGWGFVPHFYTVEEYEYALDRIKKLTAVTDAAEDN